MKLSRQPRRRHTHPIPDLALWHAYEYDSTYGAHFDSRYDGADWGGRPAEGLGDTWLWCARPIDGPDCVQGSVTDVVCVDCVWGARRGRGGGGWREDTAVAHFVYCYFADFPVLFSTFGGRGWVLVGKFWTSDGACDAILLCWREYGMLWSNLRSSLWPVAFPWWLYVLSTVAKLPYVLSTQTACPAREI